MTLLLLSLGGASVFALWLYLYFRPPQDDMVLSQEALTHILRRTYRHQGW
jgi:hypothetical protein